MMLNGRSTIYEKELTLAMKAQVPYTARSTTMLNAKQKFRVLPAINQLPNGYPCQFKYFAIGIGGAELIGNGSGYSYNTHKPTDAALYEHIPFVVRPITSDLTEADRLNYRFRVKETYNNQDYWCYYLKVINEVKIDDNLFSIKTTENSIIGTGQLVYFNTNSDEFLNPVATPRTLDPLTTISGEYVSKPAKIVFRLTVSEIEEINNALSIIYPNETKKITELAICSGADVDHENSKEATIVQIMHHITMDPNTVIALESGRDFARTFDIGGIESLQI